MPQNILTTYTETTNLEKKEISNQVVVKGQQVDDIRTPYSYNEWLKRHIGIISGRENQQYQRYLLDWYETRDKEKLDETLRIKNDYIALLQQITLTFKDAAQKELAVDINWDDTLDVEQVIPFYARKLKEIAIYLVNKRETIKQAKLKYNLAGSIDGLEKLFYEYLLKAFTKKRFPGNEYITNIVEPSTLNALPELSAAIKTFQIHVDELYDDTSYFDKDPTVNTSEYFNISTNTTNSYLTAKGFTTDQFDWLYQTGVNPLCADNPLLWVVGDIMKQYEAGIPISALETYNSKLLNEYNKINLTTKYLGESQYIVSGGYYIPWEAELDYKIKRGNNWFYWVSGEFQGDNDTNQVIDPIYISSTNLISSGATPGQDYMTSDVIFVTRNNQTSGAWLQQTNKIYTQQTMSALLVSNDTLFNYPFPGYGISGEGAAWTGNQFSNIDSQYEFLDKSTQLEIQKLYWDTKSKSISTFNEIPINETTLIDSGAYAASLYKNADKITIRREGLYDTERDSIYTGQQQYAWLYKMEKTDLPILYGENKLYWPFIRYENKISTIATSAQCISIPLSSIEISNYMLGAVAGCNWLQSDLLIKYNAVNNGKILNAAWLSGAPLHPTTLGATIVSAVAQPGITFKANPGIETIFIWEDSNTHANDIFKHRNHQTDCDYLKESHISLYTKRIEQQESSIDYNQWKQCSCKSIYHSPFGHFSNKVNDYDALCDIIVMITTPLSSFSLNTWRDSNGASYLTSDEFGWYQLTGNSIEPDAGWSRGRWITNTGQDFILSSNQVYMYIRSDLLRGVNTENAPYFISTHKYSTPKCKWIDLQYNTQTKNWQSTDRDSLLILTPGDYLLYTHRSTNTILLSTEAYTVIDRLVPIYPDFTTLNSAMNTVIDGYDTQTITIPDKNGNPYSSYVVPKITPGEPISVSSTFLPISTWTVTTQTSSVTTTQQQIINISTPTTTFLINIPLSGWNYTTKSFDGISKGARPFWAAGYDDNTLQTKYKGIDIWGGNLVLNTEYNYKSQPEFSDIILSVDTYFLYNRVHPTSFIWKQPLEITIDSNIVRWNKLLFDTDGISPLSSILNNNINELVITATNIPSNIILDIILDEPLLVNYYALNPFTWKQRLTNTTLGIPPTGGVWVPILSGELVTPLTPYAYLTNRHYPTIASVPYIDNLYRVEDSGGYFIPQMLGISTFLSKDRTVELNTLDNDITLLTNNKSRIYQSLDSYGIDYGLTKSVQLTPVIQTSVNSSWMKAQLTEWQKSGIIINSRDNQQFCPYKTAYEILKSNNNGVHRQDDKYDPWYQSNDNVWANEIDWPANFRKEHNITDWYNQVLPRNKQVYQWKTDIFTNQYALLKHSSKQTIYDKKRLPGELWTRDARNIIKHSSISLEKVYDKFISLNESFTSLLSTNILYFDIWYDTLLIHVPNYIFIAKLSFDYTTNIISTIADNINIIYLCNGKYGGTWLFEDDKMVTICTMLSTQVKSAIHFYPKLYTYNLDTNTLKVAYDGRYDSKLYSLTSVKMYTIEDPVFTHNITNQYNIAFIGYSSLKQGMYFTSININHYGDIYEIDNFKVLTPST